MQMTDAEAYEFAEFVAHHTWDEVVTDPRSATVDENALRALWANTHRESKK